MRGRWASLLRHVQFVSENKLDWAALRCDIEGALALQCFDVMTFSRLILNARCPPHSSSVNHVVSLPSG
jgi:hypothetical protein